MFENISVFHLNMLLLLGLALFGGSIGGRLFQKARIPQVVGYIAIGILLGESGLKIIGHDIIITLQPFNYFALGLIGFMIGGELKKEVLVKYGKQFVTILFLEGTGAFICVAGCVGLIGGFILGDWRVSWAVGLLLGAIASATAPAATTEVLREYKTRGPLTRTVLGIVALDDGLALLLFAVAASVAGYLGGNAEGGLLRMFIHPFYEIGGSIAVGIGAGYILNKLLRRYSEEARLLAFSIGTVLIVLGLSLTLGVDLLLASMALGVCVTNFVPRKSKEVFKLVEGFTPPIYVLFFVLVGAKINVTRMTLPVVILGAVYLVGRTVGKALGARAGARIGKAPQAVQRYLGFCLLSQAGVAIGLSILASHYFPGTVGSMIVIIVTVNTFLLEILGPPLVKFAVTKAGEVGMNVTEEDLIAKLKTEEIMDAHPPRINKSTHLDKILTMFSEHANLYYPVVDNDLTLLGIVTVDNIKSMFTAGDLTDLLVAVDVMEPAVAVVRPDSSIADLKKVLAKHNLEYVPVVTGENKLAGFIERRMVYKVLSVKLLELQRRMSLLDE
ncbi:MAG: cation:proton antiporter [Candidatus Omnitrophica bacterium]|nr:cation:proton antiporter [Candidatus Omnitrophota bacterium]